MDEMRRVYEELAMEERDYRLSHLDPLASTTVPPHIAWDYEKRRVESAKRRARDAENRRRRRIREAVAARVAARRAKWPLWKKISCGIFS